MKLTNMLNIRQSHDGPGAGTAGSAATLWILHFVSRPPKVRSEGLVTSEKGLFGTGYKVGCVGQEGGVRHLAESSSWGSMSLSCHPTSSLPLTAPPGTLAGRARQHAAPFPHEGVPYLATHPHAQQVLTSYHPTMGSSPGVL